MALSVKLLQLRSNLVKKSHAYFFAYRGQIHKTYYLLLGPLSVTRGHEAHSPLEPRPKRVRRISSAEDELEKAELTYYNQSPASMSTHTWHPDLDHGGLVGPQAAPSTVSLSTPAPSSSTYLLPHTPPLHNSQHTLGTFS